jgi:hypothetical protein
MENARSDPMNTGWIKPNASVTALMEEKIACSHVRWMIRVTRAMDMGNVKVMASAHATMASWARLVMSSAL